MTSDNVVDLGERIAHKQNPLSTVDEDGRVWRPYAVEYYLEGKLFGTTIYAWSEEHAEHVIKCIGTGKVTGEVFEVCDCDDPD